MKFKSSGIPHKLVPNLILYILSSNGKTTKDVENEKNTTYTLDKKRPSGQVWHYGPDVRMHLGKILKLDSSMWGPNRTSNDLENEMYHHIVKLRNQGIIESWKIKGRITLRLADTTSKLTSMPTINIPEITTSHKKLKSHEVDKMDLSHAFQTILRKGVKYNTYKFALARAILEHCSVQETNLDSRYEITYDYLAEKFLKYYWHQECKFRIKQDYSTNGEARAVQIIRKMFGDKNLPYFDLISEKEKIEARDQIVQNVFGRIASKKSQVVPKFQKFKIGQRAVEHKIFYEDYPDKKKIILRPNAYEFFRNNHGILSGFVLVEWAKFLERINGSLPRLIAKIEMDRAKRGNLTEQRKLLLDHECHCFYCGDRLEQGYIDVDHFIPWSYIFEDSEWNLVLACQQCNRKKSDSLAEPDFKNELIKRNTNYYGKLTKFKNSLDLLGVRRSWEDEIHSHYNNCMNYGFNPIPLP